MKKSILFLFTIWSGVNFIYSQNVEVDEANSFNMQDSINPVLTKVEPGPEHVYVIFTSQEYDPKYEDRIKEGVMRIRTDSWNGVLISYVVRSRSKDYEFDFSHWDLDIEFLKKIRSVDSTDKMNIVWRPKEFLLDIKPIDLDKEGPSMKKEEAFALRDKLVGKIIWLIDRRDITRDSLKLIQAETKIPEVF